MVLMLVVIATIIIFAGCSKNSEDIEYSPCRKTSQEKSANQNRASKNQEGEEVEGEKIENRNRYVLCEQDEVEETTDIAWLK